MADHQNGDSTLAQDPTTAQGGEFAESKGKGKAVASEQDLRGDTAMDEDDDDDEDEDAAEVCTLTGAPGACAARTSC